MDWDNALLRGYQWCRPITDRETKEARARTVAAMAEDGQVIGVGTGSSSFIGLLALADRAAREGLRVTVVPSAYEIELACAQLGLPTATLLQARPDWSFDGADEIGANGDVIKGRGGGLFREKLVAAASGVRYILAEDKKFVPAVGACPIPVEVWPEALHIAEESLRRLGAASVTLRLAAAKDGPVVTEAGNLLLDCMFPMVPDGLEREINAIPGVLESGLFQGYGFRFVR